MTIRPNPSGSLRSRDDDIGQHVGSRHVGALLDDAKEPGQSVPFDSRLELAAKPAALLRADEETTDVAPAERRNRGDQVKPALPARQPGRKHHNRRSVGQPPPAGEADDPFRPDSARIEDVEVDAARDRAQPVRADPINLCGVIGDELRNCDDPLAARHHRIVPSLERGTGVVGVVKGRHEMPPGGRLRPTRHSRPGRGCGHGRCRCPRRRMQPGQRRRVAAHQQRVLRGERQRQMGGARADDVAFQRAAAGSDIRGPSRRDERRRQIDGAALGAARDQASGRSAIPREGGLLAERAR